MDPQCHHRLSQLRERVDSQDVPSLTANYQEQLALVAQNRMRPSKPAPEPVVVSDSANWSSPNGVADVECGDNRTEENFDKAVEDGTDAGGYPSLTQVKQPTVGKASLTSLSSPSSTSPPPPLPPPPPPRPEADEGEASQVKEILPIVGEGNEVQDEAESEDAFREDACEMLLVMAEVMKADARNKFERGDFMGAAKTYRSAAESLDAQPPPSHAGAESLRERLRDLYVTCMCNTAVAGFKAAGSAPSPGESHALVVHACTRALERSGGRCPKASFWRARVKVCQHMYEAAEADLVKAVEDEERVVGHKGSREDHLPGDQEHGEGLDQGPDPSSDAPSGGVGVPAPDCERSNEPVDDAKSKVDDAEAVAVRQEGGGDEADGCSSEPETGGGAISSIHECAEDMATSGGDSCANEVPRGGRRGNFRGKCQKHSANGTVGAGGNRNDRDEARFSRKAGGEAAAGASGVTAGRSRERSSPKRTPANNSSEASRWLARVRMKIEQIHISRALAAEQSSQREERVRMAQEHALEVAKERRRHGPGHISGHAHGESKRGVDPFATSLKAAEAVQAPGNGGGDALEVGAKGAMTSDVQQEEVVWRVPKPPRLNTVGRTPAMLMNDYAMHSKFQASPAYEQVTGDNGELEYICTYIVGPKDRIVGSGRGRNMKTAKQNSCIDLLTNAAIAWNEENPDDLIDMVAMIPSPTPEMSKKSKAAHAFITEEFKAYAAAWIDLVVRDEIQEACFPSGLEKIHRTYVHSLIDDRDDNLIVSKSCTIKNRRQLSVMRRAMMEGLAFTSGGKVTVVDIPDERTLPSDIADMASVTRPPPTPSVTVAKAKKIEELAMAKREASPNVIGTTAGGDKHEESNGGVTVGELPST